MCGFAGVLQADGRTVPEELIRRMADALHHRGPDDGGCWLGQGIGLGSRRLSILDPSPSGRMPMIDDRTGAVLVYNGEIYNSPELRDELTSRGERFRSSSDTEVLLRLLRLEGTGALRKLRGMFAFAYWDGGARELLLARDPFGIKPLYYAEAGGGFLFASEIKGIRAHESFQARLRLEALAEYFQVGFVSSPGTLFEGIRKLPAGHLLRVREGRPLPDPVKFAGDVDLISEAPSASSTREGENELASRLKAVLQDSVRAHLLSDVPLGVFLSGGVDSSLIAAFMAEQSGGGGFRTFSVGFDGPPELNELSRARRVASYLKTDHYELFLTERDLAGAIRPMAAHLDAPPGDAAMFPMFELSRQARGLVKVVLTGEGSDEFFGGYRRYAAQAWADRLLGASCSWVARVLEAGVLRLPGFARTKRGLAALSQPSRAGRAVAWQCSFLAPELRSLLVNPAGEGEAKLPFADYFEEALPILGGVGAMMYADQRTRLTDGYCEKVDRSTMAAGLEARVPFLDRDVVQFALSLPVSYKIRGLKLKYLLRKVAGQMLPQEIARLPKRGFSVPIAQWFRGGLQSIVRDTLSPDLLRRQGILRPETVAKLLDALDLDRRAVTEKLWLVFAFQMWYQESFLKRP